MMRTNLYLSLLLMLFVSCSERNYPAFSPGASKDPDYADLRNWAAHPYKISPSDLLPGLYKVEFAKDSSVDVFFLHPTSFVKIRDIHWNADLDDENLNERTDSKSILYQASAFNECRVFAPRYRQANLRAYYTKDTASALAALDLAYQDLKKAFQFYLEHYNQGRPIIIASHSQGSTHAQRLLKEFFEGKPLQKQLVAAYVIGMFVPEHEFQVLGPCKDSLQTGCVICWRSFKRGYTAKFVKAENEACYVTNPLTWTIDETFAPAAMNLGGVIPKSKRIIPHIADAQVHGHVLWVNKPHFPGSFFYLTHNYHVGDINLFYMNIRQNLHARIAAYKRKH
jgi:hypothetical protein